MREQANGAEGTAAHARFNEITHGRIEWNGGIAEVVRTPEPGGCDATRRPEPTSGENRRQLGEVHIQHEERHPQCVCHRRTPTMAHHAAVQRAVHVARGPRPISSTTANALATPSS